MRGKRGPIWALTATRQLIGERVALVLLIAAGLTLFVFSKIYEDGTTRLRMIVADALTPAYEVLSHPIQSANRGVEQFGQFLDAHEENQRLRQKVERLRQWQEVARRLEQTNLDLSRQLNLKLDAQPSFITARVVSDGIGPFVRTVLVNAGSRDGIQKGQPVVDGSGVAGRVAGVGQWSARVLLLTDLNSRIPVLIEGTRIRGIAAGDNTDLVRLIFLPTDARSKVGDRLVTSGHGGIFPPGLPVGQVTAVNGERITVKPFVALDKLVFVSALTHLERALPFNRFVDEPGSTGP